MAEKFRHAAQFMDAYIMTMIVIMVLTMGGVAIWGSDIAAGRFFLAFGPLAAATVIVMKMRQRELSANENRIETREDLTKIKQQTNGLTVDQARQAEQDQLIANDAFVERVADRVAAKMPCEDIARRAAEQAVELAEKRWRGFQSGAALT